MQLLVKLFLTFRRKIGEYPYANMLMAILNDPAMLPMFPSLLILCSDHLNSFCEL